MKNQEGFSLVELIIVIAIMAVLIGLLAPQYLRFVNRAKVNTDLQNATQIADAINGTIADEGISSLSSPLSGAGGDAVAGIKGLAVWPESKVNASYPWKVTFDAENGVTEVTLNNEKVYPGDADSLEYYQNHYH